MELGKEVWYLEPKSKEIGKGIVVANQISTTGYIVVSVLNEKNETIRLETNHIRDTKKEIEEHREKVSPIMSKADKEIEATKVSVDKLRLSVIGRPEHKELALRIMGG